MFSLPERRNHRNTFPVAKLHDGRVHWQTPLEFEINMTKGCESSSEGMREGEMHLMGTFSVFVLVCCRDTGCSHCSCQQLEVIAFCLRGSRGYPSALCRLARSKPAERE